MIAIILLVVLLIQAGCTHSLNLLNSISQEDIVNIITPFFVQYINIY